MENYITHHSSRSRHSAPSDSPVRKVCLPRRHYSKFHRCERIPKRNLVSVADADADPGHHHSVKSDPDPYQSEKQDLNLCQIQKADPHPHQSQTSGAVKVRNGAMDDRGSLQ